MAWKPKILRPISLRLLTGLILVSLGVGYLLLPSHRQLLERQLRDGQVRRALATLRSMPDFERAQNPAYYAALELRLLRQILDASNSEAVIRHIAAAAAACEEFRFQNEFLKELCQSILLTHEASRAHELLEPRLGRMPLKGRQAVHLALANAALAANTPTIAPNLYVEFWESSPPAEETTTEMVRLWRFAGKPDRALAAIETFLAKTGGDANRLSPGLARLRIDLFRETAQPGRAFEALRDLVRRPGSAEDAPLFDLTVKTALESSRSKEVLPLVRERAEKSPRQASLWKTLGDLAVAAGDLKLGIDAFEKLAEIEPKATQHLVKLGQLCEWTSQPGRAFDFYLRALEQRDTAGIERLAALSEGLYRDAELAEALEKLGTVVDAKKFRLQFARLYGRVGDFELAKQLYRDLVDAPGSRFELLVEFGTFLNAISDFAPAYQAFTRAAALKPNDRSVLKALAEVQFRLGNYPQSLKDYATLLQQSRDPEVFEKYLNLAESLGDLDGQVAGLKAKIERNVAVSAYDFERLALFLNFQGHHAEYLRTLEEVLRRYPEKKNLRETAAYAYSDDGRFREALRLLEKHPDLRTRAQMVRFYLSLLVQVREFKKAEAFLASGLEARLLDTIDVVEVQAYLEEASGHPQEALRSCARLHAMDPKSARYALNYGRLLSSQGRGKEAKHLIQPYLSDPTPAVLQLAAQVYAAAGDRRGAEEFQRRYLASATNLSAPAQAWGFLGDILLARGDVASAKHAYQRSVAEMLQTASAGRR